MEVVEARVYCRPVPKGNTKRVAYNGPPCPRCRKGRWVRVVNDPKSDKAQKALTVLLVGDAPTEPLHGPLELHLTTWHPIPPSWPKWRRRAAARGVVVPSGAGTADGDNLQKIVCDALERAGWLANDCQITERRTSDRYGSEPGYRIRLTRLPGRVGPRVKRADCPPLPARPRAYFSPSDPELTPVS